MDGARRQDSLGVSSSVAEGVLTPAALHLRVSAEVERRRGGEGCVWRGKRARKSQTSFGSGDRKPSSTAGANPRFNSHPASRGTGAKPARPADPASEP